MKIIMLPILLLISLTITSSRPTFQAKIPNGDKVIHMGSPWPGVGHFNREGAGLRNPFGEDFQANNYIWTQTLCLLDSDGDGYTNGFELGDPECKWTPGQTPDRIVDITHPGFPPNISGMYDPDCYRHIENAQSVDINFDNYHVPSADTSYICKSFDLPTEKTYYAKSFSPIITNPQVHHMIVYVCKNSTNLNYADCSRMIPGCEALLFAWAIGGGNFCLPMNVSLPMGKNEASHVILQIHYDNSGKLPNIIDSSGVKITYSDVPQFHEAAYLRLGVPTRLIDLPPQKPEVEIIGQCGAQNTNNLPYDINVFGSLLHMHKLGRKIWTDQFRDGALYNDMGKKMEYDFNLQTYIKFNQTRIIKKGDSFTTHCVYDTTSQNEHVKGGEGTSSEMCINFFVYYPRLPVDSCIDPPAPGPNIFAIVIVCVLILFVIVGIAFGVRRVIINRRSKIKRVTYFT